MLRHDRLPGLGIGLQDQAKPVGCPAGPQQGSSMAGTASGPAATDGTGRDASSGSPARGSGRNSAAMNSEIKPRLSFSAVSISRPVDGEAWGRWRTSTPRLAVKSGRSRIMARQARRSGARLGLGQGTQRRQRAWGRCKTRRQSVSLAGLFSRGGLSPGPVTPAGRTRSWEPGLDSE